MKVICSKCKKKFILAAHNTFIDPFNQCETGIMEDEKSGLITIKVECPLCFAIDIVFATSIQESQVVEKHAVISEGFSNELH